MGGITREGCSPYVCDGRRASCLGQCGMHKIRTLQFHLQEEELQVNIKYFCWGGWVRSQLYPSIARSSTDYVCMVPGTLAMQCTYVQIGCVAFLRNRSVRPFVLYLFCCVSEFAFNSTQRNKTQHILSESALKRPTSRKLTTI